MADMETVMRNIEKIILDLGVQRALIYRFQSVKLKRVSSCINGDGNGI